MLNYEKLKDPDRHNNNRLSRKVTTSNISFFNKINSIYQRKKIDKKIIKKEKEILKRKREKEILPTMGSWVHFINYQQDGTHAYRFVAT